MFAGPNGSGKSTIKSVIRPELLGIYVNPDEIQVEIENIGFLDLTHYGISADKTEILNFFQNSTLLEKADLLEEAEWLRFNENKLDFFEVEVNAYYASVAADFIRQKLVLVGKSFSFETVMSAPDKIELLAQAQKRGYRTYLYFVATDGPNINISRVAHRVKTGGHDVPVDKITTRYYRSMDLLWEAVKHANRAYIFDNSTSKVVWLAEFTDATSLDIKVETMPSWFQKYVLDKIAQKYTS
jgi:predicted ABC-type ATPase